MLDDSLMETALVVQTEPAGISARLAGKALNVRTGHGYHV
jgi:hypothetical protein